MNPPPSEGEVSSSYDDGGVMQLDVSGVLLTSRSCGNGCVAITISASGRPPNYGRYIKDIIGRLETDTSHSQAISTLRGHRRTKWEYQNGRPT
jgi:hypothetical protein